MRTSKRQLCVALVLSLVLIVAAAAAGHAQRRFLTIGSTGSSSSYYSFWVGLAQVVGNALPQYTVTVLETGGTEDNLRLLRTGEAQLGQFAEPFNLDIAKGTGPYQGLPPFPELRNLWAITPSVWNWAYNKDLVQDIRDFHHQPVIPGAQGTTIEILAKDIFAALGIEPDYRHGTYNDAVRMLKNRELAGFVKASPINAPDASLLDAGTSVPIGVHNFTDAEIAQVLERLPHLIYFDVPGGLYPGVPAYRTWGFVLMATGTTAIPEDVAYDLVRVVHQHQQTIAQSYAPFGEIDLIELTLYASTVPLHAGVVRYFQEQGYEVPEALIPPEYSRR